MIGVQIAIDSLIICVFCAVIMLFLIHRVLLRMMLDIHSIKLTLESQATEQAEQRSRYGGY